MVGDKGMKLWTESKTRAEAETGCQADGGTLANIKTDQELAMLQSE